MADLHIQGLHKYYGQNHVVKGIDLVIPSGEFTVLVGQSGCGKSTLLRVLHGLLPPSAGEVRRRESLRLGMMFQRPHMLRIQAWRHVALGLWLAGHPWAQARERSYLALERVGLQGFGNHFPREISGGMQMRVSIARALVTDPNLLLMDEPFGALDEITRDSLNVQLQDLWRREQRTVVFVTHSIAEAVYLSTRIVVMSPRPGRIVKIIDSPLPAERTLALRDTPEFTALAHEVREALADGHHEH